jgi:hypothetical protein
MTKTSKRRIFHDGSNICPAFPKVHACASAFTHPIHSTTLPDMKEDKKKIVPTPLDSPKKNVSDTGNRTRALPALGSVLLDESGKS